MKLKISAALVCLLLAHPAAAQSTKTLARQYIELPAVQSSLLGMETPAMFGGLLQALLPTGVKISPSKKAAISKVLAMEIAKERPAMEKAMIEAAAKTFTADELKAMIAFSKTKLGASATSKSAAFALASSAGMAPSMQRMEARMKPQIMNILLQ